MPAPAWAPGGKGPILPCAELRYISRCNMTGCPPRPLLRSSLEHNDPDDKATKRRTIPLSKETYDNRLFLDQGTLSKRPRTHSQRLVEVTMLLLLCFCVCCLLTSDLWCVWFLFFFFFFFFFFFL